MFGGAYPELGSRSLDTDYVRVRNPGDPGGDGALLVPVTGGLGVAYQTADYHGDLGVAAVRVVQDVPDASAAEKSRVFTTSSGYWRFGAPLDVYHFAVLDVAGAGGVRLTNGSLGVDARPADGVQLTASGPPRVDRHPADRGAQRCCPIRIRRRSAIVQNNLAVTRISQDVARAGASVALAAQRFELSASGGLHRRPEVSVALADGSGAVVFPEARSADATLSILDRRSLGGLRVQLSGTLTAPIGSGGAEPRARLAGPARGEPRVRASSAARSRPT